MLKHCQCLDQKDLSRPRVNKLFEGRSFLSNTQMYICVVLTSRYAQLQQTKRVAQNGRHLSNNIKLNCFYPAYAYLRAFWLKYTPEKRKPFYSLTRVLRKNGFHWSCSSFDIQLVIGLMNVFQLFVESSMMDILHFPTATKRHKFKQTWARARYSVKCIFSKESAFLQFSNW